MRNLDYIKICKNCHKKHNHIPDNAKEWTDEELKLVGRPYLIGWIFECDCKSTIFIPRVLTIKPTEIK